MNRDKLLGSLTWRSVAATAEPRPKCGNEFDPILSVAVGALDLVPLEDLHDVTQPIDALFGHRSPSSASILPTRECECRAGRESAG
jgi:hypothetical protein